jgi:hypothetical protein
MAMGKELLRHAPYPLSGLPYAAQTSLFLADLRGLQEGGVLALANYFAPEVLAAGARHAAPLVVGASAAGVGPQMLISGVAVGSYLVGQHAIAPYVAPSLGNWLYNQAPSLFTPAPTGQ